MLSLREIAENDPRYKEAAALSENHGFEFVGPFLGLPVGKFAVLGTHAAFGFVQPDSIPGANQPNQPKTPN